MCSMWKSLKHACSIEIPDWGSTHHVSAEWTKDGEVCRRVDLLHEAVLLRSRADAVPFRQRSVELLHEEFGDKGKVQGTFAIIGGRIDKGEAEPCVGLGDMLAGMVWYEWIIIR